MNSVERGATMRRLLRLLLVIAGVLMMAAPDVMGQAAKPAAHKKGEPGVRELNFEGDVVEAEFLRPQQGVTEAVVRRKRSSLIQVRTDFVDEILKSAEDL